MVIGLTSSSFCINNSLVQFYNENCLVGMKKIPDKSIDMVLCDLPYGTTACKWDSVIPFEPLWKQYKRIVKNNGAIVLFGSEPFSTKLRASNLQMYKYDWVWVKNTATGFLTVRTQPMRKYENVMVFSFGTVANGSKRNMKYYPQGLIEINENKKVKKKPSYIGNRPNQDGKDYIKKYTNYPANILQFAKDNPSLHPTQKPVKLLEYLINTYTLEGETVLDNCFGSGSTAVACVNTNRNFIGYELEEKYYNIAIDRLLQLKE